MTFAPFDGMLLSFPQGLANIHHYILPERF